VIKNHGPTTRSHHEPEGSSSYYFRPSSDEDSNPGDVLFSHDDGYESKFTLLSGRKRRLKKTKPRVWYDETREDPHCQLALRVCFKDVVQSRIVLRTFHIAQLRNFYYHRNSDQSIIVMCTEDDCPFYMTPSKIANEKTFCIRKFRPEHTCIAKGDNAKVTINWLKNKSK
jgi:hypothetical protein